MPFSQFQYEQMLSRCERAKGRIPPQTAPEPESQDAAPPGEEAELHEQFLKWCFYQGIVAVHCRMDQKTSVQVGTPDFILLYAGRGCAIEFKAGTRKPTNPQEEWMATANRQSVPVLWTNSFKEATEFAMRVLRVSI